MTLPDNTDTDNEPANKQQQTVLENYTGFLKLFHITYVLYL